MIVANMKLRIRLSNPFCAVTVRVTGTADMPDVIVYYPPMTIAGRRLRDDAADRADAAAQIRLRLGRSASTSVYFIAVLGTTLHT